MPTEDAVSPKPISSSDVEWTEWSDVPCFALRYRHLTGAVLGEDYHVGVAIEELAPGMQSAPAHYHIFEEEHLYVLEGSLSVRIGDGAHDMKAGDYVCFPAGQRAGHCLLNNSGKVCRYVIVGERNLDEVVVYTDSSKVLVRSLGRRAIFDMKAMRGYWEGENTGLPDGQVPPDDMGLASVASFTPKLPVSSHDIPWEASHESERFGGRAKHLTYAAVGRHYHVGMLIESPAPGKRLAPRHYHMLEEEHALILEGQVTLLLGDQQYDMTPGDYVCFPAGVKIPHAFVNGGSGPCSYLMIGEHNPNEVCVYPDSNKIMVRALRSYEDIFDMSAVKNYWDGE